MLRISLVQTDLVWEDAAANRQRLADLLATHLTGTDLIVLPEMFTTGFSMQPAALAESPAGVTHRWLHEQAERWQAVVTGSYIVQENGQYYNRLLWMQPDGQYQQYDKRYLFTPGGESAVYRAGQDAPVFAWQGWRVRPFICYDLRFPKWSRNAAPYYDLAFYVASWPSTRASHWSTLLQARAIENQAYVVGVNRIGTDGNNLTYSGDSAMIDFAGNVIESATDRTWVATHTLDRNALQLYRQQLPFLADA